MSKPNKANKSNYIQAGRLTPDDMARERMSRSTIPRTSKRQERAVGRASSAPLPKPPTRARKQGR
jgi:hypothetical protein